MGKSLKTSQRTIAAVSIASLALLNVGIMAPAAHAEGDGSGEETASSTIPEPESTVTMPNNVTLKINKFTPGTNGGTKGNGTVQGTPEGSKPIGGVTFTIYKINGIDLTKNEGWKKANAVAEVWKAMTPAAKNSAKKITVPDGKYAGDYTISTDGTAADTDNNGVAKFQVSGPDRGFYVVKETITGDTVMVGQKEKESNKIVKAAPFVVALPMTDQGETFKWLNTVNVYPKNSETGITKSVVDTSAPGSGNQPAEPNSDAEGDALNNYKSQITYTLRTDIPKGQTLDNYQVVDGLDYRLLYLAKSPNNSLAIVGDDDQPLTGAVELEGFGSRNTFKLDQGDDKDYVLHVKSKDTTGATNDEPKVGTYLTVEFKPRGLKKLEAAGGKKVKWNIAANVKDTAGKTDIKNKGFLIPPNSPDNTWDPKNPPETPPTEIPSNEVISKYGKVVITKVSNDENASPESDELKRLNGAEFELYTCEANKTLIQKVSVDNKDKWVSGGILNEQGEFQAQGPAGQIIIDGLQPNDFKNSKATGVTAAEAEAAGYKAAVEGNWKDTSFYCLKETKAPEGYELLPEVYQFQLLSESANKTDYTYAADIKNVRNNGGFDLPLTGGKGIFGLIALGALLVLGSIGYIFFASRRQES